MADGPPSLQMAVSPRVVHRSLLLVLFLGAAIGWVATAAPDAQVERVADSRLYLEVRDQILAGDLAGFRASRGFVYPLVLALHQVSGVGYFTVVGLFNLLGLGLLVAVLLRRSREIAAWWVALSGLLYLASGLNVGFATVYLRESILLGVLGLHFALLVSAVDSRRGLGIRVLLVAVAVFGVVHWKGMFLYPALPAAALWIWACGPKGPAARRIAVALGLAVLIVGGTAASNPNNDQGHIGINLIGGFLRTPIPEWYADRPDVIDTPEARDALAFVARAKAEPDLGGATSGDGRADPFLLEERYLELEGRSLGDQGKEILADLIARDPARYAGLMIRRTGLIAKAAFLDGIVCQQPLGHPRGLGMGVCRPFAALSLLAVPVLGLAAIACLRRRPEAAAVTVGILGMACGLGVGIALVAYVAFDRLLLPAYLYALLGFPVALSELARPRPSPIDPGS